MAVSGVCSGVLKETPGKSLEIFPNREMLQILGFRTPGKANLTGTLGRHCRDLVPPSVLVFFFLKSTVPAFSSFSDWEKLNGGGFQTQKPGGFPLFSGKVQIVSRTLSGLFLVGAVNRPSHLKRTNREIPRRVPGQIGKIPKKTGKSQRGRKRTKKGRTSPDREAPPFETPPPFSGPWSEHWKISLVTRSAWSPDDGPPKHGNFWTVMMLL